MNRYPHKTAGQGSVSGGVDPVFTASAFQRFAVGLKWLGTRLGFFLLFVVPAGFYLLAGDLIADMTAKVGEARDIEVVAGLSGRFVSVPLDFSEGERVSIETITLKELEFVIFRTVPEVVVLYEKGFPFKTASDGLKQVEGKLTSRGVTGEWRSKPFSIDLIERLKKEGQSIRGGAVLFTVGWVPKGARLSSLILISVYLSILLGILYCLFTAITFVVSKKKFVDYVMKLRRAKNSRLVSQK